MPEREHYHQPALSLDSAEELSSIRSMEEQEEEPLPDLSQIPSIAADPEGMPRGFASNRLPNDFWNEFHLETAFREEHGMTPVSPAEFADMRDFSDQLNDPENVIW